MRKTLAITVMALALPALLVSAGPADASVWRLMTSFSIGGAHFNVGYHEHYGGYGGARYHPGYYYRVAAPIYQRGYQCNDYCYRHDNNYYHHESCPLLGAHFRYNGHGRLPYLQFGYDSHDRYGYKGYYGQRDHYRYEPYRDYRYRDYGRKDYGRHDHKYDRGNRDRGRRDYRYDRHRQDQGRRDYRYDRDRGYNRDRRNDRDHDSDSDSDRRDRRRRHR